MKKIHFGMLALFFIAGCATSSGIKLRIEPTLDKRINEMRPLSRHVGLLIDPALRNFKQDEYQSDAIAGYHHYVFRIGEPLAVEIEKMAKRVFTKVTPLDELPSGGIMEKMGLDNVITVSLSTSRLELGVEESVWRAIGKHYLTLHVSFLDKQSRNIFDRSLSVEGKCVDVVDFETEGGWWKVSGPKYGPAVEDAIEKIVFDLAQQLSAAAGG
ncbi:MAG: hypothetical protein HZB37_10065 [Planctomycetes bacterium]|nr:hypothetical protein [Planctomycetota bacterium]